MDHNIVFKWEKEMTDYITCKNILESNLKAAYTIICRDYVQMSCLCRPRVWIATASGTSNNFQSDMTLTINKNKD